MYIALKPIRFGKMYQVGDEIPENVIHPSQLKRILASGKVAFVKTEAASLLPPNTVLGDVPKVEETSAVLDEAVLENDILESDEDREAPATETESEPPEEPVHEELPKKPRKTTRKKAEETTV